MTHSKVTGGNSQKDSSFDGVDLLEMYCKQMRRDGHPTPDLEALLKKERGEQGAD